MPNLATRYIQAVDQHRLIADDYQVQAAAALDAFLTQWQAYQNLAWAKKLFKKPPAGLYLYGPVGRGKTMLLDWVFAEANGAKQRYHFHKLMLDVHAKKFENPKLSIEKLATQIIPANSLLCLDEFHVTDVADAMLLQPLVRTWRKQGCAIIFTTNWAPDDLYQNGLQRGRFLPFIAQLKKHWPLVALAGGQDYRRLALAAQSRWFVDTAHTFEQTWQNLIGSNLVAAQTLSLDGGRTWVLPHTAGRAVILDASLVLAEARGIADFLVLAQKFDVVFLNNLQAFKPDENERAKRLMLLVDALYDMDTLLAVQANVPVDKLYAQGALQFEFNRTVSRLNAMCAQKA